MIGQEVGERFTCPWCPTSVITVEGQDAARRFMEWHLDGHFSIGMPSVGAA